MALAPQSKVSQAVVRTVDGANSLLRSSQAIVRAVTQIPAEETISTQATLRNVVEKEVNMFASQALLRVIARGRIEDPHIRAWTFTLDGHDFYVLRLGMSETLVYDVHSEQWYVWGSGDRTLWRVQNGFNWIGGDNLADSYGSNVVVGDDTTGTLYFLDPTRDVDDDAIVGADLPRPFRRTVQGQLVSNSYDSSRVFGVVLEGSIGSATREGLLTVNLSYSDNRGRDYINAGDLQLPQEDYSTRAHWRSLGSLKAPGRLFKITDYGSLRRIDYIQAETEG